MSTFCSCDFSVVIYLTDCTDIKGMDIVFDALHDNAYSMQQQRTKAFGATVTERLPRAFPFFVVASAPLLTCYNN